MFNRPIKMVVPKVWVILILILTFFIFALIGAWSIKRNPVFSPNLKNKVIVIDPGHGGSDPGAQNSGLKEKDINLDISLRLRTSLESKGCIVILTREVDKDFFLPGFVLGRMAKRAELDNRINMATENNADLFISIHTNSFPRPNTYGMETYYHLKSAPGKALAELIQTQLTLLQSDNKRKSKAGDYYLINQSKMPAVIVEVGFISNPRERNLLLSNNYRNSIATAIDTGIENYFKDFPQGIRGSVQTVSQEGPPKNNDDMYKLYFPSSDLDSLFPENRTINRSVWDKLTLSQKANLILTDLIKGPQTVSCTRTITPKTKILSLIIKNDVAIIDLSKDIQNDFAGGAMEEDITIKSIVWSMTQIQGINGVSILINGEYGDSIGGHILLDHTFPIQP